MVNQENPIPPEVCRELRKRRDAGEGVVEIARDIGYSRGAVRRHVNEQCACDHRGEKVTDRMHILLGLGNSPDEIARVFESVGNYPTVTPAEIQRHADGECDCESRKTGRNP